MRLVYQVLAAIAAGIAVAVTLTLLVPPPARGAERDQVLMDCHALAGVIASFADFRDTGAKVELVARLARDRSSDTPAQRAVLEREIRRLWRERLPADDAGMAVFKRCQAQLGDMGRDA